MLWRRWSWAKTHGLSLRNRSPPRLATSLSDLARHCVDQGAFYLPPLSITFKRRGQKCLQPSDPHRRFVVATLAGVVFMALDAEFMTGVRP